VALNATRPAARRAARAPELAARHDPVAVERVGRRPRGPPDRHADEAEAREELHDDRLAAADEALEVGLRPYVRAARPEREPQAEHEHDLCEQRGEQVDRRAGERCEEPDDRGYENECHDAEEAGMGQPRQRWHAAWMG